MFFAGYGYLNTDVAVFKTENQRDKWLKEWSVFDRVPLSADEVWLIFDGMPDHVERETDVLDDSIIWLLNPINSNM